MLSGSLPWVLFVGLVLVLLALDLGVFHRKKHEIGVREAVAWTAFWVFLAVLFNIWVYYSRGSEAGLNFLTAYILEKSLSMDNIFVFLLIFTYFKVPGIFQHKVLFWGIIGALVMRAIFIFAGVAILSKFHWALYIMGAFLVFTGIKMAIHHDEEIHPEKNPVFLLCQRFLPMIGQFAGGAFFVRRDGAVLATPLFVVLVFVETSDVMFAFDSIPAILAITTDPFIVFTSNVFAILGLRSLYFALAGMHSMFHHLQYGLSIILVFIGVKMLVADIVHIPVWLALLVVATLFAGSIFTSIFWPARARQDTPRDQFPSPLP